MMPHKVPSEALVDFPPQEKPILKEPWSRLLDQLQHALSDLEFAAITDNHSRIESSAALISSLIQSAVKATESSDLDLHGTLGLVYRLKFEIPHAMEVLALLSVQISSGRLQGEVQELEVQKLLTFTPQVLTLMREFLSAVNGCNALPRNTSSRSTSPLTFFHDHSLGDVAYDLEGKLVGASITALIEEMTPHNHILSPEFSSTFFMTFRLFSSPMEVLECLISRWNLSPPSGLSAEQLTAWKQRKLHPIRFRVLNVIWQWVTRQWDSETDDHVLPVLHKFLRQCDASFKSNGVSRFFENLIEYPARSRKSGFISVPVAATKQPPIQRPLIDQLADNVRPRRGATRRFSVSLLKKDPTRLSLPDIESGEIAHQLTLIESKLFQSLKPKDVIRMAWGHLTVSVLAVVSLSADITDWVSESILNEISSKKRTASIKMFIKIAHSCLKLQNFASTHSILKALRSPAVVPLLDSILPELPYKQRTQWQSLNEWDNLHSRRKLQEVMPPSVPILALYKSDIISSLNNNPSHFESPTIPARHLLNFGKYREVAEIGQEITKFYTPYSLIQPVADVQQWLYSVFKRTGLGENVANTPSSEQRRRSIPSTTSLKRSHSLGSAQIDFHLKPQASSIHPSVSDIATIYSVPSSRTASTNYGLFYTCHAPSQDSLVGQQWWADLEA